MNISVGIVGLPNVGKSTLFNALTNLSVDASNYPFCTIEPNVGIVPIKDQRLDKLALVAKSKKIIYPVIEFVDIAGLVKGASKGEGLGNKFLSHIREVAVIAHIVRNFNDPKVSHIDNVVDPAEDIETIQTELLLKDLETLENKMSGLKHKNKLAVDVQEQLECLEGLVEYLSGGKFAESFIWPSNNVIEELRKSLSLLTDKPQIYILNQPYDQPLPILPKLNDKDIILKLDILAEYEISKLLDNERTEYMQMLQISKSGLDILSNECFKLLNLVYFFTAGVEEARAWTTKANSTIQIASGEIHTDFVDKFIAAEVVNYKDFIQYGGWQGAKTAGKVRLEGKEYTVKDGDVVYIKHG